MIRYTSNWMQTKWVYVIGPDAGPFKIGVATNLRERLCSIQIGSAVKVSVQYSVEVPTEDAFTAEARAHKSLQSFRMSGEWFGVTLQAARQAVLEASETVDSERKIARIYAERDKRDALERARMETARSQRVEAQRQAMEQERIRQQTAAEHAAWTKGFLERMKDGKERMKMERAQGRMMKRGFLMGNGFILIGRPY